jgi:type IV secretory pathway VirD2 relaxase
MGLYLRVGLCRNLAKVRAHVNYIVFRSREAKDEERGAFSSRSDHADVREFRDNLADPLTRHSMANKAYKLTISLSEREFQQRQLESWKPIVREAMDALQKQWGRSFRWIASEHMAKGHPHVHVVIKATCLDDHHRWRQLRLDKGHLMDMRRELGRCLDRHRPRTMAREPLGRSLGLTMVDALLAALQRHVRAMERQQEEWLEREQRQRDNSRDWGR